MKDSMKEAKVLGKFAAVFDHMRHVAFLRPCQRAFETQNGRYRHLVFPWSLIVTVNK